MSEAIIKAAAGLIIASLGSAAGYMLYWGYTLFPHWHAWIVFVPGLFLTGWFLMLCRKAWYTGLNP